MPTLSPELGLARRAFDYRAVMALRSPILASVTAHASGAKTPLSREDGERGLAMVYLVRYEMPFLTGPGTLGSRVDVRFDLGLSPDYPFTAPDVTVVSTPKPWSPHVLGSAGTVCIGEIWSDAKGQMLVAHLVAHVAKAVLNCDEPDRGATYIGWNAAAITYWRAVMKGAPVTSGLVYPVPPTEITHARPGVTGASQPEQRVIVSGGGLRRAPAGLTRTKSLGRMS